MENKIYQADDIPNELFRRLYPINSLLYCPSDAMPKVTTIQIGKATGIFLIREVEEDRRRRRRRRRSPYQRACKKASKRKLREYYF